MPLSLINSRVLLAFLVITLSGVANANVQTVGSVTEQSGSAAQIKRGDDEIQSQKGVGVSMNDEITTAKTKLGLTFVDDTKVSVSEQSTLVIDDFIYDPNARTGKLAMNVALGTVRYSSGAIAANSRENVKLRTPTATISVRGTDFTMTVDELGRSLVILLPTCPINGDPCWTGEIEVATDVGFVILSQAFQATLVSNEMSNPSKPVIIDMDGRGIDNMLIVAPPDELRGVGYIEQAEVKEYLDSDLLDFAELNKDELQEDKLEFLELDVNRLDIEFLINILDATAMLQDEQLEIDPVLPTYNQYREIVQAFYDEETIGVFSESSTHITSVTTTRDTDGEVNMYKDSVPALIQLNGGGDVIINITQSQ
tara:strand:+ start:1921 stop:3024 length:1104 start_codon:yes stop_codon:yes gene_type:complete